MFRSLWCGCCFLDSHRSIATQKALCSFFEEIFYESKGCGFCNITKENKEQIYNKRAYYEKEAIKFRLMYCSGVEEFDTENANTWPMHSTGGAVDLVLRDKNTGKIIDFGEGYFDNPNEITHTRFYEEKKDLTEDEKGYLMARRLAYNVLAEHELVNYGYECTHYSYQDQLWGLTKGVNAKYAYVSSPKDKMLSNILGVLTQQKQRK